MAMAQPFREWQREDEQYRVDVDGERTSTQGD